MKYQNPKTVQPWLGKGNYPLSIECAERYQSYFYQCCENFCKEPINRSYFYQNIDFDKDIFVNCLYDFNVVRCENYNGAKIRQLLFNNLPKKNKIVKVLVQNNNKQANMQMAQEMLSYQPGMYIYPNVNINNGTFPVTMLSGTSVICYCNPSTGQPSYRKVKDGWSWIPINGTIDNIIPYEWYEITALNPYYGNTLFRIIPEMGFYWVEQYGTSCPLKVMIPPHGSIFYLQIGSNAGQGGIGYTVKSVQYSFPEISFYNDYTDGFELHFVFEERNPLKCEIRIKAIGMELSQGILQLLK